MLPRGTSRNRAGSGRAERETLALARMRESASGAVATATHLARNAVECLPAGALAQRLEEGRPLRVKLGLDPTAPDLHLGHTVVLTKLREFQDAGHVVVLIVGDYTARVGDPSGRSVTRPVLSGAEIDANAETYVRQAGKVMTVDDAHLEVRRNAEWLDMTMEDLFRLARHPTVAQLLERDDFARRSADRQPISILELLYPLLQGYDSVMVRSDVELGGTDQKFNLLLGRAIQQAYGVPPQSILTLPILPGTDGERRMSKTLDNYVGVAEPPEEVFGKLMRVPDSAMPVYYDLLLDGMPDEGRPPVELKRAMARELTARFHGAEAAEGAESHFDRLHVQHEAPEEVEDLALPAGDGEVHLPALMGEAFGLSRSEARRLLEQGGVRLDGEPLVGELDVPSERLEGALLQVGKRRFRRLVRG